MTSWSTNQPSDYTFPILERVFKHYSTFSYKVSDQILVCCQHLLEPQLKMFEKLIEFGFRPENIYVIGKVYSTNKTISEELQNKGVHVLQTNFSGEAFDVEHLKNCEELISKLPNSAECVVLDDGAQLIKVFIKHQKKVRFAVEQTSSGFRKLENLNIPFPVINVARSETKLVQESYFIANDCYERIQDYFNSNIDTSILIVGLGPIGKAILNVFTENGIKAEGCDVRLGHTDLVRIIEERAWNHYWRYRF